MNPTWIVIIAILVVLTAAIIYTLYHRAVRKVDVFVDKSLQGLSVEQLVLRQKRYRQIADDKSRSHSERRNALEMIKIIQDRISRKTQTV